VGLTSAAFLLVEGLAVRSQSDVEALAGNEDSVSAHGAGASWADVEGTVRELLVSGEKRDLASAECGIENRQRSQLGRAGVTFDG